MTVKAPDKLFLLGHGAERLRRFSVPTFRVRSRQSLIHALGEASPSALWMAVKPGATDQLLHEAIRRHSRHYPRIGGLLTLHPPRPETIQPLDDLFKPFVWGPRNFHVLPFNELTEVLADERRGELFIGGYVDPKNETLTLVRGDLRRLSVPLSIFPPTETGPAPDPSRLAITDCGNTIRLGSYEAASDSILYDADPDYRSRLLAERRAEDQTFGACLRRLRLARGLRQCDFGEVTAKTIARIERGETEAPHGRTLAVLAKRLKVDPEEITSY